jgi:hypothetical protein
MDENLSRPDPKMLELLVCPISKGRLVFDREKNELVSEKAKLAYPKPGGWKTDRTPLLATEILAAAAPAVTLPHPRHRSAT